MNRIINPPIKPHPIEYQWPEYLLYSNSVKSLWKGKWTPKGIILQLLNRVPDSNAFTINRTTYDEVQNFVLNLRNDCSSGHSNIPVKFLKPVVGQITSPIIQIINTSIDKDIFLDSWKVARVCPIPKIDNPVTVRNFRPISILSVLSKVYEKSILSQLLNYIEKSAVYNPTQSGFRKGHSTITLWKALSRNEIISVLTDYSKAFDAINQKTLLEKLVSLNFSNRMIT